MPSSGPDSAADATQQEHGKREQEHREIEQQQRSPVTGPVLFIVYQAAQQTGDFQAARVWP